jgi:hypothetical protein
MRDSNAEDQAKTMASGAEGIIEEPREGEARTSLLENSGENAKSTNTNTNEPYVFRHRPGYLQDYGSFTSNYAPSEAGSFENRPTLGDRYSTSEDVTRDRANVAESIAESVTDGLLGPPKKRGTTYWLAKRAGITSQKMMYVHENNGPTASTSPFRQLI